MTLIDPDPLYPATSPAFMSHSPIMWSGAGSRKTRFMQSEVTRDFRPYPHLPECS